MTECQGATGEYSPEERERDQGPEKEGGGWLRVRKMEEKNREGGAGRWGDCEGRALSPPGPCQSFQDKLL